MRTRLLTVGLVLLLAGTVATTALAQTTNNSTTPGGTRDARLEWQKEHSQNLTAFRRAALESFEENRTILRAQTEANFSHIRTTFLDGKVAAIEDCYQQAAPYGRTANGPHDGKFAACMKDKLASLRDNATAAHKAEVENWAKSIAALRDASKQTFQDEKAAWEAAHPKP